MNIRGNSPCRLLHDWLPDAQHLPLFSINIIGFRTFCVVCPQTCLIPAFGRQTNDETEHKSKPMKTGIQTLTQLRQLMKAQRIRSCLQSSVNACSHRLAICGNLQVHQSPLFLLYLGERTLPRGPEVFQSAHLKIGLCPTYKDGHTN